MWKWKRENSKLLWITLSKNRKQWKLTLNITWMRLCTRKVILMLRKQSFYLNCKKLIAKMKWRKDLVRLCKRHLSIYRNYIDLIIHLLHKIAKRNKIVLKRRHHQTNCFWKRSLQITLTIFCKGKILRLSLLRKLLSQKEKQLKSK